MDIAIRFNVVLKLQEKKQKKKTRQFNYIIYPAKEFYIYFSIIFSKIIMYLIVYVRN